MKDDNLQDTADKAVSYFNSASDQRTTNNDVRHQYKVLNDIEKKQMMAVKDLALDFMNLCDTLPPSREVSLAKTKIEEATMWAVKSITK